MVCFTAPILHRNRIAHLFEQLIELHIKIRFQTNFNCLRDAKLLKLAESSIVSYKSLANIGAVQAIYAVSTNYAPLNLDIRYY